jgi:hypothetical protein
VFFSNGPGDPAAVGYAVEAVGCLLAEAVPLFGICLGSQIVGRALGLGTYKLRFGHRGVNQPVADLTTGHVQITSHNHGFAVALPGAGPEPTVIGEPGVALAAARVSPAALAPFETPWRGCACLTGLRSASSITRRRPPAPTTPPGSSTRSAP